MGDPLLTVENLNVSFSTYLGKIEAVRGISFSISKGETLAIVGESGCGKSVTAQAIMGLIPPTYGKIEQGKILFQGKDLCQLSEKEKESVRGKEIGMIFQDPLTSLNPTMTIGKQLTEGIRKHEGLSYEQAASHALEILKWVGIPEPQKRMKQYPHELSGGMRQRIMIAIALMCNPKLLIADEPTTALDVTIQAQILQLLKNIQKEKQTSIILITHDLGIVAGMCDRVIVMYGGKILEIGNIRDLFYSPFHPYTQGLLRSIPRLDMDKNKELIPIEGSPPSLLNPPVGCPFVSRCPFAMRICAQKMPPLMELSHDQQTACWLKLKSLYGTSS